MQVYVSNISRSTDVLRCSSVSCVELVWQYCCVRAWSQFLRCPHSLHVFSHCQSQVVLSNFPTDRFFFGPIIRAPFVMAASECGAWCSSESHRRTVEPRSAGVHGHCVAWKTTLVLTGVLCSRIIWTACTRAWSSSMREEVALNEIDLAFACLDVGICLNPMRIEQAAVPVRSSTPADVAIFAFLQISAFVGTRVC